jgi:hypothetical protein
VKIRVQFFGGPPIAHSELLETDVIGPARVHVRLSAALLALSLAYAAPAAGQESLTVALLPGAVSFVLASNSASNPGTVPIGVSTTWTLGLTRTNVALYAYFTSAAAALTHSSGSNTVNIPSSRVEGSVNGGAAAAFSQTVTFGAPSAGLQLFSQAITAANRISARADALVLNINLSGYVLPADTYTGSLHVRAQATP